MSSVQTRSLVVKVSTTSEAQQQRNAAIPDEINVV